MGSEWISLPISEIGDVKSGKRLPKGHSLVSEQTLFPYIRLVDISQGKIRKENLQYLMEDTRSTIKRYVVNQSDVVLAIVGHTIGMVFYVDHEWDDTNLTENAARITNISSNVNSKFLYYFLISPLGQLEIVSRKVGSAQGKLPLYNIRSLEILLPPLREQKAIAHILGSLDDKIELNRQMNETLEAMAQALFKSWFVDFDPVIDNALAAGNPIPDALKDKAEQRQQLRDAEAGKNKAPASAHHAHLPNAFEFHEDMDWIPEGWEVNKLSDLIEVKYGKDHKKLEQGSFPVYGSGGIMRYVNKSLYKGESVLIPRKGSLNNLMYVDEEFWSVDTMFFSMPKKAFAMKYVFYFLRTFDFVSMNVGSAVPSMTTKVLNDIDTLAPAENALKLFDKTVAEYLDKVTSLTDNSDALSKLRDTLLPKLLSGELRIPDAEKLIAESVS